MANIINLLDDTTANQIAAGEVVERPASVVKELVENSIDAGARQVVVRLDEGGKRLIEVADDGSGMSSEDAVLSVHRHATSKIRHAEDLFAIHTLGFRGEALPSIASVSRFALWTKHSDDDLGVAFRVDGGAMGDLEPWAGRDGTRIVVEDLFYNTPARLKFMKATSTEATRAIETVGLLAVAHPNVAVRVINGPSEPIVTTGNGDRRSALAAVWGREVGRQLLAVTYNSPGLDVTGFVAPPDQNRPGRSHELFFVNGRSVRSRMLSHAVEEAFRSLTPDTRFPMAAVLVEIDPGLVDVNVHPTKAEVKFTRDGDVHHAVGAALREALVSHGLRPSVAFTGWRPGPSSPASPGAARLDFGRTVSPATLEAAVQMLAPPDTGDGALPPGLPIEGVPEGAATGSFASELQGFRVLGQLRNTYIVCATAAGLALIDQHVAHERVLYERLMKARTEAGVPTQRLAVPISIAFGAAEAALLATRLADFREIGWELEHFGANSFLVRALPSYSATGAAEALLRDMVDELAHQSVSRRLIVQRDHVTITNACKMAVKAGDPLSMEEMRGLIDQLVLAEIPFACPHGRPAVVTVPIGDIDRRFKR